MAKRVLFPCAVLVLAAVMLGAVVSLVGNPISGDSWGHRFPNGYLYLDSHQQAAAFRVDRVKSEVGLSFGRCHYIWDTK